MKKTILILGGLALLLLGAVMTVSWFFVNTLEGRINQKKTEPMRRARWAGKNGQATEAEEAVIIDSPQNTAEHGQGNA